MFNPKREQKKLAGIVFKKKQQLNNDSAVTVYITFRNVLFFAFLIRSLFQKLCVKNGTTYKWDMFYAKETLRFPLTYLVNALKYAFSLFDALNVQMGGGG